jgi:hypothetical protein
VIGRAAFPGFARELIEFLSALERNNDKAWFDRNRKTYERLLLEPAKRLVAAMQPALATISPDLRAEPKVGGSILRIARDVRFRQDKTPYKTTLDMMFWEGHRIGAALRRALDLMLGRWSLRARRAALQTHPARLRRQPPAWLVEALNLVRSDLEAGDAAR